MTNNSLYDEEGTTPEAKKGENPKKSAADLSVTWKEALSQIDYGFDLESSTIFVFGDIAEGSLYDLITRVRALIHMRSDEHKEDPINLVINSDGGDVYEALGMIDYIDSLSMKVNTICRGRAMSAAALLLTAGTGTRAASPNSTIMFHEISSGIFGKASDMKANMQHMEHLEEVLLGIISGRTKKDVEYWEEATQKDYYITPEEALELGVVDVVLEAKKRKS